MKIDTIPTLETTNLLLTAPDLTSFDAYKAFYMDAEASNNYGGPFNEQAVWNRLKSDLGSWLLCGFGVWVIREKDSNNIIGTAGFWQGVNWPRELTWWLLPAARGKGYAVEASIACIDYAYQKWNWTCVETYMNDENVAARKLVEKLGGKVVRREGFPDGLQRNIYLLPKPGQINEKTPL